MHAVASTETTPVEVFRDNVRTWRTDYILSLIHI